MEIFRVENKLFSVQNNLWPIVTRIGRLQMAVVLFEEEVILNTRDYEISPRSLKMPLPE